MFIYVIIYYENFNRLRTEGGVQASGTAWRFAGGDQTLMDWEAFLSARSWAICTITGANEAVGQT
ncbi:hypothetical protein C5S30_06885 [ANME-1 cluster archaeon GoMg4]|nr:hypothetical protein [ANME-1 cluster archaeon GoMg4]NMX22138.1 hypothetical protein [ANME-1 cluster archaeon GoMg4]